MREITVEPRSATKYDTERQRYTVQVIRETDEEFICASKYHAGEEFILPKFAWQLADNETTIQDVCRKALENARNDLLNR